MITPLLKKHRHEINSIVNTILLAILVISIDFVLGNNFKEYHARVMFIIWIIIAYKNRKFIGRFLAVVIIDIICWPLFVQLDLPMFSRIAGFYLSQLDMALIIIFILWFVRIYSRKSKLHGSQNEYSRNLSLPFIAVTFVFIIAMISGFAHDVGIKPVFRHGKILMIYLAYFPLRSMLKKRDLVHLFSVLMVVIFCTTAYTLYEYLIYGQYIEPSLASMSEYEASNPYFSSRVYAKKIGGHFDLLMLPAASWAFIMALYSQKYRKTFLYLMFFFLSGVVLNISRAYTLGHIAPLIVIALVHFPLLRNSKLIIRQRKLVIAAGIISIIIIFVLTFVLKNIHFTATIDRLGSLIGSKYGATALNIANTESRMYGLLYGFKIALENPFGSGFGSYVQQQHVDYSVALGGLLYHSLPLYLFYTFGLIGGGIILIAWVSIILIALKQFRRIYGINSIIAGVVFSYILSQLIAGGGGNTLLQTDTLFPVACASLKYFPEKRST